MMRQWILALLAGSVLANSVTAETVAERQPATPSAAVRGALIASLQKDAGQQATAVAALLEEGMELSDAALVERGLSLTHPGFARALSLFDEGQAAEAASAFETLAKDENRFLAATAAYYHARALVDLGRADAAAQSLDQLLDPAGELAEYSLHRDRSLFLRAFCAAEQLDMVAAEQALAALSPMLPESPEALRVGAQQLGLELSRREQGTLGEVASVMDYAADRLAIADAGAGVRARQDQVIEMLDKLIEETEQQEQQSGGGGGGSRSARGGAATPGGRPTAPRERSEVEAGQGEIGELREAPKANPGEAWGQLPPAEREKILQALRDRFPSRYRQLVEQYYRSLAEQ